MGRITDTASILLIRYWIHRNYLLKNSFRKFESVLIILKIWLHGFDECPFLTYSIKFSKYFWFSEFWGLRGKIGEVGLAPNFQATFDSKAFFLFYFVNTDSCLIKCLLGFAHIWNLILFSKQSFDKPIRA